MGIGMSGHQTAARPISAGTDSGAPEGSLHLEGRALEPTLVAQPMDSPMITETMSPGAGAARSAQEPFDVARTRRSVFQALLDARDAFGGNKIILEDHDRTPLSYDRLILAAFVLGGALSGRTDPGETVGVMLPSAAGAVVAFFALSATGRTPAMLNFTSGARNIRSACVTGTVRRIVTARKFVDQAGLQDLVDNLAKDHEILWLDDIREKLTLANKLTGALKAKFARMAYTKRRPDDPAVVLFTSGTEGAPKGVVLSNANVVANVEQVRAHIELEPDDVVLNPLPVFHCFGLTAGVLLPLLLGKKCILYPSPLHHKIIPALARETRPTILLATDTFLRQYARAANPEDFKSLRFCVCGAEKVTAETRKLMLDKFGAQIVEGYGATEAAPIVSANQLRANRHGTVGRLMPGIEIRLEPVPGIPDAGRLFVRGPNIMIGYLKTDAPGVLQPLPDGWHDTGDIVAVDGDGFLSIQGRLKRFAKLGGEMVSLAAVESYAQAIWPENMHAAVSIPDPRKGETLILLTDRTDADTDAMRKWAQSQGVPELQIPKRIVKVAAIPVLGSGKTDYGEAQKLAQEVLAA